MQGFNMGRYVPPDQEGLRSGNQLHKKHALGARASRLATSGLLTVRFEMPFAVWCSSCPKPTLIPQGVRFNAAKSRCGNYHSTPIWSFAIRHPPCGGELEIRTDPANTAYVVARGGTKRQRGERSNINNSEDDGSLVPTGDALLAQSLNAFKQVADSNPDPDPAAAAAHLDARESAIRNLEKTIDDRKRLFASSRRIDNLLRARRRGWGDPYTRNKALRKTFRSARRTRERNAARTGNLRDRMSLGIALLPASERDARAAAKAMELGSGGGAVEAEQQRLDLVARVLAIEKAALARPLFSAGADGQLDPKQKAKETAAGGVDSTVGSFAASAAAGGVGDAAGSSNQKGRLKREIAAGKVRSHLMAEILGSARASKDPFLEFGAFSKESRTTTTGSRIPGVKRGRGLVEDHRAGAGMSSPAADGQRPVVSSTRSRGASSPLVEYGSESD